MKTYICVNYGECIWADEKPPREFSLPDSDENVCPNCEKNNIQEAPKPPGPPWAKIALAVGLLLLLTGAMWLWGFNRQEKTDEKGGDSTETTPLVLMIDDMNCETGVLSLRTLKGDGSPVMFGGEGLKSEQNSSSFVIPKAQRRGKKFMFFAVQSKDTVSLEYTTNCSKQLPPPPPPITWTRVPGSEFCDDLTECVQVYSERNNLGQIRERRIENCADCGAAKK